MLSFFEFLIDQFKEEDQADCINLFLKELESSTVAKSSLNREFLCISNESVYKMARIASWFLERESNADLFDENGLHVDIHEKLKYAKYRFEFVKKALIVHAKMTALGYKRDFSGSFKNNFNKMLSAISTSKSLIAQLGKQKKSYIFYLFFIWKSIVLIETKNIQFKYTSDKLWKFCFIRRLANRFRAKV